MDHIVFYSLLLVILGLVMLTNVAALRRRGDPQPHSQLTPDQMEKIKNDFRSKQRFQLMMWIPLLSFPVIMALLLKNEEVNRWLARSITDPRPIILTTLLIIIGILIVSFRTWRCPLCGNFLGTAGNPLGIIAPSGSRCPHCGVNLS